MGLVYSKTDNGLVVAEHGSDEASVARALRAYDDGLRLVRQASEDWQRQVWKVYRYAGSDRPAEFLCAWITPQGEPLPLSMRLVDMVAELDRNSRAASLDADVLNAAKREREERQAAEDAQALAEDWQATEKSRPILHRGIHLRRSREKQRARGENV